MALGLGPKFFNCLKNIPAEPSLLLAELSPGAVLSPTEVSLSVKLSLAGEVVIPLEELSPLLGAVTPPVKLSLLLEELSLLISFKPFPFVAPLFLPLPFHDSFSLSALPFMTPSLKFFYSFFLVILPFILFSPIFSLGFLSIFCLSTKPFSQSFLFTKPFSQSFLLSLYIYVSSF